MDTIGELSPCYRNMGPASNSSTYLRGKDLVIRLVNYAEPEPLPFSCRTQMAFRDGLAVVVQAVVVGTPFLRISTFRIVKILITAIYSSAILMLRTLAVYGRNRKIVGLFALLFIGVTVLSFVRL